ncbi:peptidylprolyl isomerase [Persicitalea jodogahamensis]|uniref:peptidylprolyl isomerase n=1 Tax=Persicitalea jodogahamensis TaxID=402147 RepID=A0A8J3D1L0_9BACT|nr:peptidylprolyl isomerase [Persicitalea jodogahamensis]GHB57143.1 peptidyl-prolyl cis-trans isomerase [Persicitalea jodogahamensis]
MNSGQLGALNRRLAWFLLLCIIVSPALAQKRSRKDYLITLTTEAGAMQIILFDKTPLHKANFLKLAEENFYDGLLFHRVIENFMIQGGDPNSRNAAEGVALGNGSVGYRIPAEFRPDLFHQKGAIAAARDNNPEKESSGCQFYIVQGRRLMGDDLEKQLARAPRESSDPRQATEAQKEVYRTIGGSPHLDGNYTVFGQVIDGLAVIDSIAARPRDARDRPLKDVTMQVSVKKMRKKKITKKYGYRFDD